MLRQTLGPKLSSGFVTLSAVLILGSIAALVTTSMLLIGVNESKTAQIYEQTLRAKSLADGCAELALEKIRDDASYSGSQIINVAGNSCTYVITVQTGEARTIDVSGEVGDSIQRVKISIDSIKPRLNISSWQEVAIF